jgi:REP-associated tyrosine transposase
MGHPQSKWRTQKSLKAGRPLMILLAGGPAFHVFPSRSGTLGAPSLRSLQGRVRCCLYHGVGYAQRPASHLRRSSPALYHYLITTSCYRRLPFLHSASSRDTFLTILEQTRQRYRFLVVGYVVMPEHILLLLTEPEVGTPSTVMQVLKQRSARALLPKCKRRNPCQRNLFEDEPKRRAFWQARSYDFNVRTTKKRVEKLRYMHRNPVKRGLVGVPEQWRWSSYRFYLLEETGPVKVNEGWGKISFRDRVA